MHINTNGGVKLVLCVQAFLLIMIFVFGQQEWCTVYTLQNQYKTGSRIPEAVHRWKDKAKQKITLGHT